MLGGDLFCRINGSYIGVSGTATKRYFDYIAYRDIAV
jgi:hypothetical protein